MLKSVAGEHSYRNSAGIVLGEPFATSLTL
jgi:hypothetical protein